jgi:flagellar biosynthesis protein FliR
MMIGFTGQILFAGSQLDGTLRETQMGLRLANTIDPNNGQQIAIV